MENTNNILTGLVVAGQVPLDAKTYVINEATLMDLGPNNNLAYTYHKGLKVNCIAERTIYEWKEMGVGEEGLLPTNFTYPNGLIVNGIDYSNKQYNFVSASIEQNNYVRQLIIDIFNLPSTDYLLEDLINYILALPEEERTILETDSKWNIVVAYPSEGGFIISEIYELQNKGKGVITELENENLLLITKREPSWNDTLRINSNLIDGINTQVNQSWAVFSNQGVGTSNGFYLVDLSYTDTDIPIFTLGAGIGQTITERSLSFYTDRTVFMDGLNSKGIIYRNDYSANFTNESLITKRYADAVALEQANAKRVTITNGTNTTVTGDGLTTPYQINTPTPDGSETKVVQGSGIVVSGSGTTGSPYNISAELKYLNLSLSSWSLDNQHSLATGLTGANQILSIIGRLVCTVANNGYVSGDSFPLPDFERNDAGGIPRHGVSIQYNNTAPSNLRIMSGGEVNIASAWTANGSPSGEFSIVNTAQWEIKVTILYI